MSLLVFRDYINKLQPSVKGVAMKIKKKIEKEGKKVMCDNCDDGKKEGN